jgi:hypothetical protein
VSQILVTKPGVLNARDRAALRKAGVVTVEADNPNEVRLIQAEAPALSGDEMLHAAIACLNGDGYRADARAAFVKVLTNHIETAIKDRRS